MKKNIKNTYTSDSGRKIRVVYFNPKVQEFIFRCVLYGFTLCEIKGRYIILNRPASNVFQVVEFRIDIDSDYEQVESRFFNPVIEIYKSGKYDLALKLEKVDIEDILID